MDEFVAGLSKPPPELLILLLDSPLVVLADEVELVEADKLVLTLLDVGLEVVALVFEDPDLLHEVVDLGVGLAGGALLPDRHKYLIFSLLVGADVDPLVHTVVVAVGLAVLVRVRHPSN